MEITSYPDPTAPFRSAIVKLTAVCNLDCTYCYMFNLQDRTFERVPKFMEPATAHAVLGRISEHARTHGLDTFDIVLHGGEPSLWPRPHFKDFLETAAALAEEGLDVSVSVQTNALRYDPALFSVFAEYGVGVGVSVDGPASFNDQFRVDKAGRGSYDRVIQNVERMFRDGYGSIVGGFLTVANPDIPPEDYLDWISSLPKPSVSVLWPIEYNHDAPPYHGGSSQAYHASPRYGVWFADLFEAWWRRDDPDLYIRHFFDVICSLLGSRRHGDSFGNEVNDMLVVNTDGRIEYPDYYRSYQDGGSYSGLDVFSASLDDARSDDVFAFNLDTDRPLPVACGDCPHADICGGGFLAGRMSSETRLPTRRSVLCPDHEHFFDRVKGLVFAHVGEGKTSAVA